MVTGCMHEIMKEIKLKNLGDLLIERKSMEVVQSGQVQVTRISVILYRSVCGAGNHGKAVIA